MGWRGGGRHRPAPARIDLQPDLDREARQRQLLADRLAMLAAALCLIGVAGLAFFATSPVAPR